MQGGSGYFVLQCHWLERRDRRQWNLRN